MKLRVVGGAAVIVALAAIVWGWTSSDWEPERERAIASALGWVASAWLVATLTASLVKRARSWRRALGITTAGLALAHAVAVFIGPLSRAWSVAWTWPRYRAGLVALGILVVLLATSFPKRFKAPEWNALHRLIYAAALLVVLHVAKLAAAWLAITVAIAIVALLVLRLPRLARKR